MSTNQRKKKLSIGSNDQVPITRRFLYDFSTQGGAVGAITLKGKDLGAEVIPAGAVIKDVITNVLTAMTSGGLATVKLGITGSDAAFKALTAFDDAAYVGVDTQAATTPLKVGATDVSVLATVAVAALTAGKIEVLVTFVPPAVVAD